jgi:2-haloacid dehalogenase
MSRNIKLVAFDVLGTLFSIESMRVLLPPIGLGGSDFELWWARILRDGCALSATGSFEPFDAVAEGALRAILAERDIAAREDYIDQALGGFANLDPYPDADAALALLKGRGLRLVTLGNGSAEPVRTLLKKVGLAHHFESSFSIDDVRLWKPRSEVYVLCARACGLEPEEMAMVSAHAWDIHGAREAGLHTAWPRQLERRWGTLFLPPDVMGDSLLEVAQGLIDQAPSLASSEQSANF